MGRLIYALIIGAVGAVLVHIAIAFLLPQLSKQDAWAYAISRGEAYKFNPGADKTNRGATFHLADPLFRTALCHFDLDEGPVRLFASGDPAFWSVAVFSRSGLDIFSNNDRTSPERVLDLLIANPADATALKKDMPPEYQRSILVESDTSQAFAILRAFEPDASWRYVVSTFLDGAQCNPAGS